MKNKQNLEHTVSYRVSNDEYEKLNRRATKYNLTLSKYTRKTMLSDNKNVTHPDEDELKCVRLSSMVDQILNYVIEKYPEDEILEKECDRIWNLLSL